MTSDTRFSHHSPCPKCGSKDNLGVWEDGHKYCFGCRYWEPAIDSLETLGKRAHSVENNYNEAIRGIDTSSFTPVIPSQPLAWLKKYGLTNSEIAHFGICYNTAKDTLVFPVRDDNGQIVLTNERYFGNKVNQPKYVTYGHKNKKQLFIINPRYPETLVIVEDAVSAIKLSRFVSAVPLFGATMPANALKWCLGRFHTVRVWLDMDKASQSLIEAAKASQFIPDARSIITELDPKEYSADELVNILKEYKCIK